MRIVMAVDSFKGSLSSMEAAEAIADGIRCVFPHAEIQSFPLADGGEGTVETVLSAQKGVRKSVDVQDPLGRVITASYGILPQGHTAVLEMAAAAGLPLLKPEERNPLFTDTYGVGFSGENTKVRFLNYITEKSELDSHIRPETTDRVLTLSTCSGRGSSTRWVIHARLKMIPLDPN